MTEIDETTCEQLSAWMDGALPAEEARFLERRLEHDAALRAKWERMQLASSVLRGHVVRPMPQLAERVAAALAAEAPAVRSARKPILGWAIAAGLALAAIGLVPKMFGGPEVAPVAPIVTLPAAPAAVEPVEPVAPTVGEPMTPSLGTADLVAEMDEPAAPVAAAPGIDPAIDATGIAASPEDFPLDSRRRPASWPRSTLPGSDADMSGYLVRHNQMAGADALGGFVPYLDVVAAEEPATAAAAPAAAEGAAPPAPAPATEDDTQ